jgi:hypothetical protein
MTRRVGLLPPLFWLALAPLGCIDIEQAIELREDLSGSARFSGSYEIEPMAYWMAWGRNRDQGAGEPTPQQVQELTERMKQRMTSLDQPDTLARDRRTLTESLPPGVSLVRGESRHEGTRGIGILEFAFADPAGLDLRVGSDRDSPFYRPFAGLRVRREGRDLLVSADLVNPLARAREQAGSKWDAVPAAEREALVARVLGSARVRCSITAPFEVVEHNASRRQQRTLTWEFDLEDMKAMDAEASRNAISVRYRRPGAAGTGR